MIKIQFPHFPRINPAWIHVGFRAMLWAILAGLIVGNVLLDSEFKKPIDRVRLPSSVPPLEDKRKTVEFIETWQHIAVVLPHYHYAYNTLAAHYFHLKETETAREYLKKAFILNPVDPLNRELAKKIGE